MTLVSIRVLGRLSAALVLIAAAVSMRPVTAAAQGRSITGADLDGIITAGGITLSPDGRTIAFYSQGSVWTLSTAPGATPNAVARGFLPAWSPDGAALVFYAPAGDDVQIFRHTLANGETAQVTERAGGVTPDQIGWSSTDRLVFIADVPFDSLARAALPVPASAETGSPLVLDEHSPDGYAFPGLLPGLGAPGDRVVTSGTELFVHDLATGETRQLTHDGAGYTSPAWSPDGRRLVAVSREGRGIGNSGTALHLFDVDAGTRTALVPLDGATIHSPAWSPDGGRVAYAYHPFADAMGDGIRVVQITADGGAGATRRVLAAQPEALAWTDGGRAMIAVYATGVAKPVFRVEVATGESRAIGTPDHLTFAGSLTVSESGVVAWASSTGRRPFVLNVLEPGHPVREIYEPNPDVANWALGEQEVIRWTNRHGHARAGVLIKPVGYRPGTRYPLIVAAYSQGTHFNGFQRITHPAYGSQLLAARGYAVFFPGPRLPWHYGTSAASRAESDDIRGPNGWDVTVDDIESGVDVLIERGIADPQRLAIMGHSNGGGATVAVVTRSNRYKAAIAVAPANLNWLETALFEDNRSGRWVPPAIFTGIDTPVWENPDAYLRGSPVFAMDDVETPLMLAIGDRDDPSFTLPTVEMYLALRAQGKPVTLLRYAEMRHSLFGPAAADLNERISRFLDTHLGGLPSGSR